MLPDELPVPGHHAAEVLGPGPVHAAVDDHVPDLLRPQFLRVWREAQEGVDLPLGEELHRLRRGMRDPGDVLPGIQPHVGHHAGEEDVLAGAQLVHRDGLPLQVTDRADPLRPEQLEAADMHPRQDDDRIPRVHLDDEPARRSSG